LYTTDKLQSAISSGMQEAQIWRAVLCSEQAHVLGILVLVPHRRGPPSSQWQGRESVSVGRTPKCAFAHRASAGSAYSARAKPGLLWVSAGRPQAALTVRRFVKRPTRVHMCNVKYMRKTAAVAGGAPGAGSRAAHTSSPGWRASAARGRRHHGAAARPSCLAAALRRPGWLSASAA
jgi:hypothetical protein